MAETVKKSRIVSDDVDLEETLMEEFNLRLKHCLSQDPLETDDDHVLGSEENVYENIEITTKKFIDIEKRTIENYSNGNDHQEEEDEQQHIYENVGDEIDKAEDNQAIYEDFKQDAKPSFTLFPADCSMDEPQENIEVKSVKDRMFLACDETSTLLFTQTVTSPMLTPSEENVDFLKGFQGDSTPNSSSPKDGSSQSDENLPKLNGKHASQDVEIIDEDMFPPAEKIDDEEEDDDDDDDDEMFPPPAEKLNEDIQENIYENLENLDNNESIYENVEEIKMKPVNDCFNKLGESFENSTYQEDSETVSEAVSQIEQPETFDFEEEEEKTCVEALSPPEPRRFSSENARKMNGIDEAKGDFARSDDDDEKDEESALPTPTTRIVDSLAKNYDNSDVSTANKSEKNREKDTETVPAKIVQNLTSQFMKNPNENEKKEKKCEINQLKSIDIMKQINKFEKKDESLDSTQITESYVETSSFDTSSPSNNGGEVVEKGTVMKKKRTKKSRKEEKENISVKSSFSKFDALQKKNVLHIRSSDSTKAQEKFNGASSAVEITNNCKCCGKQVFQMEQIKAEKAIWHKNCFRCNECSKQLNVDTYESHEGTLYCKPHFKALFAPKAVDDSDEPPSDKPDLGLEELQSLNVKQRFQVFEQKEQQSSENLEKTQVNVKRSASILSKLAKFQAKGMDVGVADDSLNGIPIEDSSSAEDEEENDEDDIPEGEDPDLVRAKRVQKEKPFHFTGMSDVKNRWEHGGEQNSKDERREERKQEIQSIRNKLFMGKQGKMKEAYQEAVMKSESSINVRKEDIQVCDTKTIKERFEKGEIAQDNANDAKDDDEIFESEISKNSRSLFLQLDANASKPPQISPITPPKLDVKKGATPEREIYHDPDIIRSEETQVEDSVIAKETHTATKMLNKFRQMEENYSREPVPQGPKPLKCFTPPPEPSKEDVSSGEELESEDDDDEEVEELDHSKVPDGDLIEAQKAARAKQLRAKFEKWEVQEIKREQNNSSINIMEQYGEEQSQIESTKLLRARFESMRENHAGVTKPRVKVNRFVDLSNIMENCEGCEKRVYPLEKISVHGHLYHKTCFKCKECSTVLRMDSYTYNQGMLYCTPHFKRLFITKGNYDSAFGLDGHEKKWNSAIA